MMANTLQKVLDAAFKERDKMRDTYVSIEHLVLGLVTQVWTRKRRSGGRDGATGHVSLVLVCVEAVDAGKQN
jgi:hypothetical protein